MGEEVLGQGEVHRGGDLQGEGVSGHEYDGLPHCFDEGCIIGGGHTFVSSALSTEFMSPFDGLAVKTLRGLYGAQTRTIRCSDDCLDGRRGRCTQCVQLTHLSAGSCRLPWWNRNLPRKLRRVVGYFFDGVGDGKGGDDGPMSLAHSLNDARDDCRRRERASGVVNEDDGGLWAGLKPRFETAGDASLSREGGSGDHTDRVTKACQFLGEARQVLLRSGDNNLRDMTRGKQAFDSACHQAVSSHGHERLGEIRTKAAARAGSGDNSEDSAHAGGAEEKR